MGTRTTILSALALLLAWSPALALEMQVTADPYLLVDTIMGPGVTLVGPPIFTGGAISSATFTGGGVAGIGFESGILLPTGDAALLDGPNKTSFDPLFLPEIIGDGARFDTYTDLAL